MTTAQAAWARWCCCLPSPIASTEQNEQYVADCLLQSILPVRTRMCSACPMSEQRAAQVGNWRLLSAAADVAV